MKAKKELIEKFGEWLQTERNRRNVTIEELATITGISRSTIINLEQKKAKGLNPATRSAIESYFAGNVAVCTLKSINNSGLEHLRELFGKIADIVLSNDFSDRVEGTAKALKINKKEAIIYILEVDLKK